MMTTLTSKQKLDLIDIAKGMELTRAEKTSVKQLVERGGSATLDEAAKRVVARRPQVKYLHITISGESLAKRVITVVETDEHGVEVA